MMYSVETLAACGSGVAGCAAVLLSLVQVRRCRNAFRREAASLRDESETRHKECLRQLAALAERAEESGCGSPASPELLRDGRMGIPARSGALRMLRSGMAPDTVAVELGMAKAEVRLLGKVGALLAPRG